MATGTTPNGTAWTSYSTTIGGETIRWGVANAKAATDDIPFLHYTHGNAGGSNQFEATSAWAGLRNWLIDNGWAWIEGTGGGSQSWGGPAARAGYEAQYGHVSGVLHLGVGVVLGRSMGGLVAYWMATQGSYASSIAGLIINSGTTDLAERYAVADSGDIPSLNAAYGVTGAAKNIPAFTAASVGYDPMLFAESFWTSKSVLQMFGTADTTVPPADHAIPWAAKYADDCASFSWDIREGGDHSTTNGSYLQVDAMTSFLARFMAAPPTPRVLRRARAAYRIKSGGRHAIRPKPPTVV